MGTSKAREQNVNQNRTENRQNRYVSPLEGDMEQERGKNKRVHGAWRVGGAKGKSGDG